MAPVCVQDRNTNVARMGWVAGEVARHRGVAICSTISPFQQSRDEARAHVEGAGGGFILIHISTPASECAKRDVKGLYAAAAAGGTPLTGVTHPYELPDDPELTINAAVVPVETSVKLIIRAWLPFCVPREMLSMCVRIHSALR